MMSSPLTESLKKAFWTTEQFFFVMTLPSGDRKGRSAGAVWKAFDLNPDVKATSSPAILEVRAWLERYDESRGILIDLSQAAPPYAPPNDLLARISNAAKDPEYARYGPVPGEPALRDAYARYASEVYNSTITRSNVSITAGANQAFVIAAMAIAWKGDAVILPVPWYFNHKMTLDMLGIETRELRCDESTSFIPDVPSLLNAIDDKVRALVLVTPNNPTGACYPADLINAGLLIGLSHANGSTRNSGCPTSPEHAGF